MTLAIRIQSRQIAVLVITITLICSTPQICRAEPGTFVRIAGLESSQLEAKLKGLVLVEELNCVACHAGPDSLRKTSKAAPRLTKVSERVNPYYLESYIQKPSAAKLGTTMPDVMSHLQAAERKLAAQAITQYLLSLGNSQNFYIEAIDTVAAEHGEELFHSVGCVACHSPRNPQGKELLPETSTPLGALENKYNTRSLADFLRMPHKSRPSGRMPDLRLSPREAEQISHYLLRETKVPGHLHYTLLQGRVSEGLESNVTREKAGHVEDFDLKRFSQLPGNAALIYEGYLNLASAGEYDFFLQMNGGELWLNDAKIADLPPSSRRGVKSLPAQAKLRAGWNKVKLVYIHTGQEPKLSFEIAGQNLERQAVPASMLSISQEIIPAYRPYPIDQALIDQGKQYVAQLGCAKCHDDLKVDSPPQKAISELADSQGCLSDAPGPWPQFSLNAKQKELLRTGLASIQSLVLDQREIVNKSLVTFNCIACHERADLGGITPERDEFFVGSKKELGNQGRIPPPLSHVGAKLQTTWIKEVMLHGKHQRDYLATRMPQFGEANVGHLVELFEQIDHVDKVDFAAIKDVAPYKQAGHQLIGTTGFSCIACHDFNGQRAAGPGAMEIIYSTERLKKDWFYWYLLNPARFQPNTIMPAAWPGGHVFKTELLDGDAKKQIESIWIYLADGTHAKNPIGLSRKSPELRVTDEPVICRGRGNAGYRGIAVGYPKGLSLAFSSQEMNLRLLWKGSFARVSEGSFNAIGTDQIEFPPGIPFHYLKSLEDNWPYKRDTDYLFPQDHGYQFRGYYLDQAKRPTFMYRFGDVQVEEYFEDQADSNQTPYFRRQFTFQAPVAQPQFYFRAAAGKQIAEQKSLGKSDPGKPQSFKIDRLTISIKNPHQAIIRDGEQKELLIPLDLPQGKSTLELEYRW